MARFFVNINLPNNEKNNLIVVFGPWFTVKMVTISNEMRVHDSLPSKFSRPNIFFLFRTLIKNMKEPWINIFLLLLLLARTVLSTSIFLIGIHSMQGWTTTTRHGVTRKRNSKRWRHTGNCLERTYSLKMSVNSRLKAI